MKSYKIKTVAQIAMAVAMHNQQMFRYEQSQDGTWICRFAWCNGYGMSRRDATLDCRSRMLAWMLGEDKGRVIKKMVAGELQWVKK